jgi:hypothetical protein
VHPREMRRSAEPDDEVAALDPCCEMEEVDVSESRILCISRPGRFRLIRIACGRSSGDGLTRRPRRNKWLVERWKSSSCYQKPGDL